MAFGNSGHYVGNMTRDPELRYTPGGRAVANFSLALNESYTPRDGGEKVEKTHFVDIVCWGSLGENVSESIGRGARVIVVGRIQQRNWETPEGDKRSKLEVVAEFVGPELTWASAEVTKNERRGGGGNYGDEDAPPYAQPSTRSASGGQKAATPPAAYDYDEEPF